MADDWSDLKKFGGLSTEIMTGAIRACELLTTWLKEGKWLENEVGLGRLGGFRPDPRFSGSDKPRPRDSQSIYAITMNKSEVDK